MSTDAERRGPRNREFSAGGVVVRGDDTIVIIPVRRAASGRAVVALPKGHIDPGETAIEAAAREVREEAGVDAEPVEKLGDVRYWYQRGGDRVLKVVTFFLFRYRSGSVRNHDREVDSAEWIPLEDAPRLLAYKGERQMAELAMSAYAQPR